jgi:transcriptional regulator with XRE-family HTH domain
LTPRRLASVLKQKRETLGLSQRDLARKARVTPGYVAQLEMGVRRNPTLEILKRLAKALGVPVGELIDV